MRKGRARLGIREKETSQSTTAWELVQACSQRMRCLDQVVGSRLSHVLKCRVRQQFLAALFNKAAAGHLWIASIWNVASLNRNVIQA